MVWSSSGNPFIRAKRALSLLYTRITQNRIAAVFLASALVHFAVHVVIYASLISLDWRYSTSLSSVVQAGNVPSNAYADIEGPRVDFKIATCYGLPWSNGSNCYEMFPRRDLVAIPTSVTLPISANSTSNGTIVMSGKSSTPVTQQCIHTMVYPVQHIRNTIREDLTFMVLQLWLLGIAFVATIYDSIPHIIIVLITRSLTSGWSMYTIWRSGLQKTVFGAISRNECALEIFSVYFAKRMAAQIPDLIFNCSGLLISVVLSIRLVKIYRLQAVKRLGAPKHISQLNKYFLAVKACLHLETFVITAAMGLWLDQLFNTYVGQITRNTKLYETIVIGTAVLLLPWIALGLYAIRRERKRIMTLYLVLNLAFLTWWSVMFYSKSYRLAFLMWPFLGCATVASLILLATSLILSVKCWMNFGRGLSQYLRAEEALSYINFTHEVFEHDVEGKGLSL